MTHFSCSVSFQNGSISMFHFKMFQISRFTLKWSRKKTHFHSWAFIWAFFQLNGILCKSKMNSFLLQKTRSSKYCWHKIGLSLHVDASTRQKKCVRFRVAVPLHKYIALKFIFSFMNYEKFKQFLEKLRYKMCFEDIQKR